ncbi:uncharacterized protein [Diadema setosum]|uniref:uncharacterized protein n=1 Tax=Diadema setosum TaxID=31175 RepID=UPI003B3BA669
MQPYSSSEENTKEPTAYELSFPHIKLASQEDELLNKSLLDSLSPTPSSSTSSTPYRLPKLSSSGSLSSTASSDRSDKPPKEVPPASERVSRERQVQSRKNLATNNSRARQQQQLPIPPYTISQLRRLQNIQVPSFKRAQFEPLLASPIRPVEIPDLVDEEKDQEAEHAMRASTRFTHASRTSYGPRSAAVSMTIPMATGSVYSRPPPDQKAEWRLSPYRHKNFDQQAVSPNFGPYSRGFVIHCTTPKSWLHMKLRRTKTTLM